MQNFFHFAYLNLFFYIHLFLQNTHISLSIIHIYSNKIFIFLTLWIVIVRGERNEKRVRWREEREKKNKEIIYIVNSNRIYIHGYYLFARPLYIFRHFYKNWCGGFFALKCVKLSTFCILEDCPWAGVVALSIFHTVLQKNSIFLQIEEKIGIFTPFARERQNYPNPNCPSLQPHSFCSVLF